MASILSRLDKIEKQLEELIPEILDIPKKPEEPLYVLNGESRASWVRRVHKKGLFYDIVGGLWSKKAIRGRAGLSLNNDLEFWQVALLVRETGLKFSDFEPKSGNQGLSDQDTLQDSSSNTYVFDWGFTEDPEVLKE